MVFRNADGTANVRQRHFKWWVLNRQHSADVFILNVDQQALLSTGLDSLLNVMRDPLALQIVWDIRLPRSLGAWLTGALLGLAGAIAQGLFRNPLADPYLLGSASGASLGVAVALAVVLSLILDRMKGRISLSHRRIAQGLILLLPLFVGVQRIAAGRHFLSDVLLSAIFVLLCAVLLKALIFRPRSR